MARSDFVKALIKAHVNGDNNAFRQLALQIAAKEASAGHNRVAQDIRDLIDNVVPSLGQQAGRVPPDLRTTIPRASMLELLHASYPRERLVDMVLTDETREALERVIDECKSRPALEARGLSPRSKLLLVGPPGCGKTMSARVLASELGYPLFEKRKMSPQSASRTEKNP